MSSLAGPGPSQAQLRGPQVRDPSGNFTLALQLLHGLHGDGSSQPLRAMLFSSCRVRPPVTSCRDGLCFPCMCLVAFTMPYAPSSFVLLAGGDCRSVWS